MSPDVVRAALAAAGAWYRKRPASFRKRVPWDEVRQAALVGAWTQSRRHDASKASARSWAMLAAVWGVKDWLRVEHAHAVGNSHARMVSEGTADYPTFRPPEDEDLWAFDEPYRDDAEDFAAVMSEYGGGLEAWEREAVRLTLFEGMTQRAAARVLGCSETCVWNWFRAAVGKLQRNAGVC
jgi:RNA polymerase sigma factor (sigma-70 family)